ncbi:MAG: AtpZ/AtpI family protein [Kiloniellaceae bacterium]
MSDDSPPPSRKDLDARLREAQAKRAGKDEADRISRGSGLGFALRIATELVVGIGVGVGIGWALDFWLGTGPLFLIVFFFLGAGAGILNVYRAAAGYGHAVGYGKRDNEAKPSDTER